VLFLLLFFTPTPLFAAFVLGQQKVFFINIFQENHHRCWSTVILPDNSSYG